MLRHAVFPILLLLTAGNVAGQTSDRELLDTLLENGTLTAEQHAELIEGRNRPAASGGSTSSTDGPRVEIDADGIEVSSADGRFSLQLDGRLHADWTRHFGEDGPAAGIDGTDVRRARLGVGGRFDEAWSFVGETDFAGDEVAVKDFWLAYDFNDALRLTVGHQKQPYSLALEMSSNDLPFVERSVDNALIVPFVDRAVGVRVDAAGSRWFVAAGLYGESISDNDEGWGTAGRLVFAPVSDDQRVLHFGIRGAYREPDAASDAVRIRAETTDFSDLYVVDTALITGVERIKLLGPEAAFAAGPFSVTGEYNFARIERAAGDLDFDSWHVAGTWSLGGESRAAAYAIESGEFKRLRPSEHFSRTGGGGAWELAARFASIDVNDGQLVGGEQQSITLGANWYANRNVRVMLDWTRVVGTDESNAVRAASEGLDTVTMRAQYAF